mmetsp:Transcript_1019/g.1996  ORF Transcript_1019/g.1996 Transcript_1019/m.1996 type:complete len:255 (+) Transcript_1019:376-1140(+)
MRDVDPSESEQLASDWKVDRTATSPPSTAPPRVMYGLRPLQALAALVHMFSVATIPKLTSTKLSMYPALVCAIELSSVIWPELHVPPAAVHAALHESPSAPTSQALWGAGVGEGVGVADAVGMGVGVGEGSGHTANVISTMPHVSAPVKPNVVTVSCSHMREPPCAQTHFSHTNNCVVHAAPCPVSANCAHTASGVYSHSHGTAAAHAIRAHPKAAATLVRTPMLIIIIIIALLRPHYLCALLAFPPTRTSWRA